MTPVTPVLLDANLLVLYVVGLVDRDLVRRFKNTQHFSEDDLDWLRAFVGGRPLVATPHVLTEVSNLGGQLSGRMRERFFAVLAQCVQILDERAIPSRDAVTASIYGQLGLTDATIERVAATQVLILSTDAPLVHRLQSQHLPALNFWHFRLSHL